MWLKGQNYAELLCGVRFLKDFLFYSNVAKDLKRSLPAGLGLSETQITSHGFDSTKEGVIEAGSFQGKEPIIFKDERDRRWEKVTKWYL